MPGGKCGGAPAEISRSRSTATIIAGASRGKNSSPHSVRAHPRAAPGWGRVCARTPRRTLGPVPLDDLYGASSYRDQLLRHAPVQLAQVTEACPLGRLGIWAVPRKSTARHAAGRAPEWAAIPSAANAASSGTAHELSTSNSRRRNVNQRAPSANLRDSWQARTWRENAAALRALQGHEPSRQQTGVAPCRRPTLRMRSNIAVLIRGLTECGEPSSPTVADESRELA